MEYKFELIVVPCHYYIPLTGNEFSCHTILSVVHSSKMEKAEWHASLNAQFCISVLLTK